MAAHKEIQRRRKLARDQAQAESVQSALSALSVEALVGVFAAVCAQLWLLFAFGDANLHDLLLQLRGRTHETEQIAMVTIDEATVRTLERRTPLPRAWLASLIETISAAGPRAIAIDVLLDEPGVDPEGDARLEAAIANAGNVVVVSEMTLAPDGSFRHSAPLPRFQAAGVRFGYANLPLDPRDERVRDMVPLRLSQDGRALPSFSLRTAAFAAGFDGDLEEFLTQACVKGGQAESRYLRCDEGTWQALGLPGDYVPTRPMRINYMGPPGDRVFPVYTADVVAMGFIFPDWFADRIVFIGASYYGAGDAYHTPYSGLLTDSSKMPGVEIHAHAVEQMLSGQHLRVWPRWSAALLTFGAFMLPITLGFFWRPLIWVGGSLLGLVGMGGLTAATFLSTGHVILPFASPFSAGLFGILISVLVQHVRIERGKRRIEKLWGRQLSEGIRRDIELTLGSPEGVDNVLRAHKEEVTMLVARIHGLDAVVADADLDAERLFQLVQDFMAVAQEKVFWTRHHHGTSERFQGDEVVAFFGLPHSQGDRLEALRAIDAARDLLHFVPPLLAPFEKWNLHLAVFVGSAELIAGAIVDAAGGQELAVLGRGIREARRQLSRAQERQPRAGIFVDERVAALVREYAEFETLPDDDLLRLLKITDEAGLVRAISAG